MKQITLAILLIVFALTSCHHNNVADDNDNDAFVLSDTMMSRIQFADVKTEQVKGEIQLNGKITPDEDKLVDVYPLVGGNVKEVNIELGQFVEKGKILAVIRSGEVADYEKQLIDAQSDVSVAEKNLQTTRDLFESKLTSEKDLLSAQKELEKAKAGLNRIQQVFEIYGINSSAEYVIKAPISGFVIERNIARDMQLRSDKTDNVFTIAQISDVYVTANVYETDISKIQEGLTARISVIAYPDRVFTGKIDRVFSVLDPQTKTMKVRIKLPNSDYALKPEMNATIGISFDEKGKQLPSIPSSAVIFDKSRNFVMIFKDRKNIETRPIEIYKQAGGVTYISSGLKEGEKVISKNQLFIYDALND